MNKERQERIYTPVYFISKLDYRFFVEIMLLLSAIGFAMAASALPAGMHGRLGPSHVPLALATVTALAACICIVRTKKSPIAEKSQNAAVPCAGIDPVPTASLLRLIGAIFGFAATIDMLGLMLAGTLSGALAARATAGARLLGSLIAGMGMTTLVAAIFVGLVGQPLPLLPAVVSAVLPTALR